MEVAFDLSKSLKETVERLDKAKLKWMNPRKCPGVQKAIDDAGALSAKAQGLKKPLTTFEKLADSDDDQSLYLMWKKNEENTSNISSSIVIGFLKDTKRKLYLSDANGKKYITTPVCVLDFFVHPTFQKQGYSVVLFNHLLEHEKVEPSKIAFDKPSTALLEFLKKNYNLADPVWQSTNYAVFPDFFEDLKSEKAADDHTNGKMNGSAVGEQHHIQGQIGEIRSVVSSPRPCQKDSVGGIIHGDLPQLGKAEAAVDSPQGRKNTRDFGHQSIW